MHYSNRRLFLHASSAALAVASVPAVAQEATSAKPPAASALTPPDQRKGRFLERDGAKIFYQTFGQGEPILLLHGYPLSGALFSRVVGRLAQSHLVILVDHRGYGMSTAPSIPDSVQIYAEDALAVLDELKLDQAVIGGMSMGGPIVFAMYKMAPKRFSGMVLIDTNAAAASPAEAGLWNGMATWIEQKGVAPIVPFLLPQMLTGETRAKEPAQADYLKSIVMEASKDGAIGGAKALANRPDAMELLAAVDVPTLVLVGRDDPLYAFEIAQKMQAAIKGAKLHVVPGAAHAAIFEKPDDAGMAIEKFVGGMKMAK